MTSPYPQGTDGWDALHGAAQRMGHKEWRALLADWLVDFELAKRKEWEERYQPIHEQIRLAAKEMGVCTTP